MSSEIDDIFKFNRNVNIFYAGIDKVNKESKDIVLDCNEIQLNGIHNYENILACFEIASLFNINDKIISNEISNFSPLAHRMEEVNTYNKIIFINDSSLG